MKFEKPFLSIDQQIDRLTEAGMSGDRKVMAERLEAVSYHRLSGYWFPFKQADDKFKPGTTFDQVWKRYAFDRQLRLLVMDAIERFEITLRSRLAHYHAEFHGPFGYAYERASRPEMNRKNFPEFYFNLLEELARSKEPYIKDFYEKHGDEHDVPPIWEAAEVMTFGAVVTLFRASNPKVKQRVSSVFKLPDKVMDSWLLTLNTVRNICAHHGRLWNRELGLKPLIPRLRDYPDWHTPVEVKNERVFCVLTMCRYCLSRVAAQSNWPTRIKSLIKNNSTIPIEEMGFPTRWEECPIWAN